MSTPLILGIAGGSGSGKSTIAHSIIEALGASSILLQQDHYYRPQGHLPPDERARVNYDHPDSLELDLLTAHVDALRSGQSIVRPTYDFTVHDRDPAAAVPIAPAAVIVVEGILVLADERLRSRFEVKLFVDTDPDIRVMRRIRRDLEHRGRTFAQVRQQYYETVRPMHLAFVEPSKRFADIVIPEGGKNSVALDFLMSFVRQRAAAHAEQQKSR